MVLNAAGQGPKAEAAAPGPGSEPPAAVLPAQGEEGEEPGRRRDRRPPSAVLSPQFHRERSGRPVKAERGAALVYLSPRLSQSCPEQTEQK